MTKYSTIFAYPSPNKYRRIAVVRYGLRTPPDVSQGAKTIELQFEVCHALGACMYGTFMAQVKFSGALLKRASQRRAGSNTSIGLLSGPISSSGSKDFQTNGSSNIAISSE